MPTVTGQLTPAVLSPRARTAPGSVVTLIALEYQNHAWFERFSGIEDAIVDNAVHGGKDARDEGRVRRIGDRGQDAGHACPRAAAASTAAASES